jgi:hypothetical protein
VGEYEGGEVGLYFEDDIYIMFFSIFVPFFWSRIAQAWMLKTLSILDRFTDVF